MGYSGYKKYNHTDAYASFANLSRQKVEVLDESQADAGDPYSDNSRTE